MKKLLLILPGLLCLGYGISVALLRSGSRFYLLWMLLGVFFLFLATGIPGRLFKLLPFPVRLLCLLILAVLVLSFVVIEGFIFRGSRATAPDDLDVLIVLGAQLKENGPSYTLKKRLDTAAAYLASHPDTRCIVSGGQGVNEPTSEAQGMYEYLTGLGIDAGRITMEDASSNTIENIRFSMQLLDPENDRVGIVTSNFHLFRGMAIAKKQGIRSVYGLPSPTAPAYLLTNAVREYFGVMKDLLMGNMAL